jgi:hypothetical protein
LYPSSKIAFLRLWFAVPKKKKKKKKYRNRNKETMGDGITSWTMDVVPAGRRSGLQELATFSAQRYMALGELTVQGRPCLSFFTELGCVLERCCPRVLHLNLSGTGMGDAELDAFVEGLSRRRGCIPLNSNTLGERSYNFVAWLLVSGLKTGANLGHLQQLHMKDCRAFDAQAARDDLSKALAKYRVNVEESSSSSSVGQSRCRRVSLFLTCGALFDGKKCGCDGVLHVQDVGARFRFEVECFRQSSSSSSTSSSSSSSVPAPSLLSDDDIGDDACTYCRRAERSPASTEIAPPRKEKRRRPVQQRRPVANKIAPRQADLVSADSYSVFLHVAGAHASTAKQYVYVGIDDGRAGQPCVARVSSGRRKLPLAVAQALQLAVQAYLQRHCNATPCAKRGEHWLRVPVDTRCIGHFRAAEHIFCSEL